MKIGFYYIAVRFSFAQSKISFFFAVPLSYDNPLEIARRGEMYNTSISLLYKSSTSNPAKPTLIRVVCFPEFLTGT